MGLQQVAIAVISNVLRLQRSVSPSRHGAMDALNDVEVSISRPHRGQV